MTFSVNGTTVITTDRIVVLKSGVTGSRPGSPSVGQMFFDTTLGQVIVWNGSAWRTPPSSGSASIQHAWTWGTGQFGRLGDNSATNRSSPVSVAGVLNDWVQISAANQHTVALRPNGQAWAWGRGTNGRLGNGSTASSLSPISVVGGFTDWIQISANQHTIGIRANGQAWAWGLNSYGQIGDGTITGRSSPVSVVGGFTNWTQISAGYFHTAAIRTNGQAWVWGRNSAGQLGTNNTTNFSSPVSVVGGFTNWLQISAGAYHTVGLRTNGQLWSWGSNTWGQLGTGNYTGFSSPVSVVGGFTDWAQVSAGNNHTAAVRANGQAWCWGINNYGQLGDNTFDGRTSPRSVVGGFTDWVQISAGNNHTAAIRANGQAWCWGYNNNGQLGDGTTTSRLSPVSVVGGFTDWVQISVGKFSTFGAFTAAIRSTARIQTVKPLTQRNP